MDVTITALDGVSDKIEKLQFGSFHIHFIRRLNMTDCENGAHMRAGVDDRPVSFCALEVEICHGFFFVLLKEDECLSP